MEDGAHKSWRWRSTWGIGSMEMEITKRTWAILIHNHMLVVLIVLLQYGTKSFTHTVEVE